MGFEFVGVDRYEINHESFSEPAVFIKQLDANAAPAIERVGPNAVYFSIEFLPEGRHELQNRSDAYVSVHQNRGSGAADLDCLGWHVKWLARRGLAFYSERKLDRNARTTRPLGGHSGALRVSFIHKFY